MYLGRYGKGNIDLWDRPVIINGDGTISTEYSLSFYDDSCGKEVLIPTIIHGQYYSENDAIDYYYSTGEYLGKFDTVAEVDEYAEAVHSRFDAPNRNGIPYIVNLNGKHLVLSSVDDRQPVTFEDAIHEYVDTGDKIEEFDTYWEADVYVQKNYGSGGDPGMGRRYNYVMGFRVNNTPLPDPSEFTYQVGDLDTSGSRDATGLLHRAYVATKINYEISWNSLDWAMLQVILGAVQSPQFTFTGIDPRTFNTTYTGTYYVGDRTGKAHYFLVEKDDIAQFSLKLKFIEY